jgi:hypothetical protein
MIYDKFLVSQVFAAFAFLCGTYSYQLNDRKNVLLCWSACGLLNSLHFALLGAITPSVITAITGSRFLLAQRTSSFGIFLFFICASLTAGFLTYERPLNLIPIGTSLIGTTAVFYGSNLALRLCLGFCSVLWLYHNIVIGSPVASVMECVFLLSNFIGYIRLRKRWIRIHGVKGPL